MGQSINGIAAGLLALPMTKRALLAERLLRSLDEREKESAKSIKARWAEEAERRLAEVRSGKVRCLDGDEVLREVRNRKKRR